MLKSAHLLLLNKVQASLLGHGETELAEQVASLVNTELERRVAMSAAAKARAAVNPHQRGRPPSARFTVSVEPGWEVTVLGLAEAHKLLAEALAELGAEHLLPKRTSLNVRLSTGGWWRTVETENGTFTVSATRIGTEAA